MGLRHPVRKVQRTWDVNFNMGWLRLVGSFQLYVCFAEICIFYRALLQKRPVILRRLLIVATPYHFPSWSRPILGSFQLYVSFAEYCIFYRALLQKRPVIYDICTMYLHDTRMYVECDICITLHTFVSLYIHLYHFTYICINLNTFVSLYIHLYHFTYICITLHTFVSIQIHLYQFTYICINLHTFVSLYINLYHFAYICITLHTFVSLYIHLYHSTYICIYMTHIYMIHEMYLEERWGAGVEYHFQEFNEPYAPS